MSLDATQTLLLQIEDEKLPKPELEWRFCPRRKWRWDLCWPDLMIAVEIQGMIYAQGRHTRGKGYQNDLSKMQAGISAGWTVVWFSTDDVQKGTAISLLTELLVAEKVENERRTRKQDT